MSRALGILLPVAALLVLAAILFPPVRLAALTVAGRSSVCPFSEAVRSHANWKNQIARKDRILKGSRLVETDAQGYERWQTPHGEFWVPKGSRYALPFNLAERERHVYGAGSHAVQPGDVVLDCGANVGTDTRAWVEAGARVVVAIEPAPENVECLRRNFAREVTAGKVVVVDQGVWDKEDVLTFQVDPGNSAADSFVLHPEGSRQVQHIRVTTIDGIVSRLKLDRVDVIKMDIEGAEKRALAGGRQTISRFHPRMSIATEHLLDDQFTIPRAVRAIWADYKMQCGPCEEADAHIRPEALYFQP